jgi:hypothetical protein
MLSMPFTWTLRMGPVVHRESIPLSQLYNLRGNVRRVGDEDLIRFSGNAALFAAPAADEASVPRLATVD